MSTTRRVYPRMLRFLRPYFWPHFAGAMACMVLFSGTNGVMPFLVRSVFDEVFAARDPRALLWVPLAIVGTFAVRALLGFGAVFLTEYVGHRVVADLRRAVHDHLQALPVEFFRRTPTGTILSRVTGDVQLVRSAVTEAFAALLKDTTSLAVLVGVAFFLDPLLATVALVVFPISVGPVVRLSRKVRGATTLGQETMAQMNVLLQETSQGNRVVKAFGMENYERERFGRENERLFSLSLKASRIKAATNPIMEMLAALGMAGVVLYGGWGVLGGGRTQGEFMAFLTALLLVYEPFKGLARANNVVQQGVGAASRVFEILDAVPEAVQKGGHVPFPGLREEIRFEGVVFRYDRDPVLRGLSLSIRKGEVVALVGPSGAGKSTIVDLLARFYDVEEGRILVDGRDIREFEVSSLRRHIGLVTQQTFLFNDTIRANIAYGAPSRPFEDVVEAAKAAYAHDFIVRLPEGYDTVVGELGLSLSGGERQRIAIARALLKDPSILLLDEATSALDRESELLVQAALERLMEGRTTVVVAHRLSTIRRADRIVVVRDGRVAEEGKHEELLERNAEYRRLYDLQFVDVPAPEKTLH
ncbi:MAG: ABC transporter ATP-binding protein [Candidatus Binatia bacterium]|nr:MAG: ABC transporter ATP-binding protein [Candidatus Binatia bacterium]